MKTAQDINDSFRKEIRNRRILFFMRRKTITL
jgi:hypothetical protein